MIGYACDETPEFMPLPIMLAHKLVSRVEEVRRSNILDYLGPDCKSQVTVEYDGDKPVRVDAVVLACQHTEKILDKTGKRITEKARQEIDETPKMGTSGLRGLAKRITDFLVYTYTRGHIEYLLKLGREGLPGGIKMEAGKKPTIYIGGDRRTSTPRIMRAVAKAVRDSGFEVVYAGKVPTQTLADYAVLAAVVWVA